MSELAGITAKEPEAEMVMDGPLASRGHLVVESRKKPQQDRDRLVSSLLQPKCS